MRNDFSFAILTGASVLLTGTALVGIIMWGLPQYSVYSARMKGEAKLAEAEFSRQVQVTDAEGKVQAAKKLAEAGTYLQTTLSKEYLQFLEIQARIEIAEHGNATYFIPYNSPVIAPFIPAKPE